MTGPTWLGIPDSSTSKLAGRRRIAATYGSRQSCASGCPFLGLCYAETGPGGSSPFRKAEQYGVADPGQALDRVRFGAPFRAAVRHLISGNPTPEYVEAANVLHAERPDLDGWGYMHPTDDVTPDDARGWTLNVSCESLDQAAEVIEQGWQAVLTVRPDDVLPSRIAGRRVVECPNLSDKRVKCSDCNLCRRDDSTRPVVVFRWHGAYRGPAAEVMTAARAGDVLDVEREQDQGAA